jgi:(4S)-4-hydroxy-5-phosphonooxypentane-2,3-dione isomerase
MSHQELTARPNWIVTVEFTIQAGFIEQFMARLAVQASESLREAGCAQFDVCVDPSDEHRVFLYEVYSDRAAFGAHLESAHFKEFDALTRTWVDSKQVSQWRRAEQSDI